MKYDDGRVVEVGYSKDRRNLEVVVPAGTRTADLPRLFGPDFLARLPRGCEACISGDHLLIRERLENVIRVDLDQIGV